MTRCTKAGVHVQLVKTETIACHATPADSTTVVGPIWGEVGNDAPEYFRMLPADDNELRRGNHPSNYRYAKIYREDVHSRMTESTYG